MNGARLFLPFLLLGLLLTTPACGKKGAPVLPEKGFNLKVSDLRAKWEKGYFVLSGKPTSPEKTKETVSGCRVYYGQYPLEKPPCDTCPIEYQGYHGFGPEVIADSKFYCKVPGKLRGHIYYFKVYLAGPEGDLGPSSNSVRVTVE